MLFKGSESVKSIGRCTQCNRGFQQVSVQTQQKLENFLICICLNDFSPPLFRAETVTGASAGVLLQYQKVFGAFFAKMTLVIRNQNHIQFLWQTTLIIQNPKSHFNRRCFQFFLANDFNHQKSKITFQGKHRGCKGTAQALPGLQVTLCFPNND